MTNFNFQYRDAAKNWILEVGFFTAVCHVTPKGMFEVNSSSFRAFPGKEVTTKRYYTSLEGAQRGATGLLGLYNELVIEQAETTITELQEFRKTLPLQMEDFADCDP